MKPIATIPNENKFHLQGIRPLQWQRIIVLVVLGYEAAGALLGATLLIAAPDGHYMDMPVEIMHGIFDDFLIPGIILMGLGILNAIAFVMVLRRTYKDGLMAVLGLGGFVVWFVVEIIILKELHWLHLMWGLPVLVALVMVVPLLSLKKNKLLTLRRLLWCGILSSLWYIAINIYVPTAYQGYSMVSYTVSELSAINAPTRILWVLLVLPYPLLFGSFGWGVLQASEQNRPLRLVGKLIIAYCLINLYWPPMHMRGVEPGLTDTLHIVWAAVANIFMWLFMGFGAMALGRRFRTFTVISIALHLIFGVLTFMEAPNIMNNGPTPFIGLWERINIFIFMLWVIVFAAVLPGKQRALHKAPVPS